MRATPSDLRVFDVPKIDPADYCPCGCALNARGKCFTCDNPNRSLPADDPRRFSFDLPAEDNPNPFGFGRETGTDRIRSRRGPRVAMGRRS